jgi:hypothetical protein
MNAREALHQSRRIRFGSASTYHADKLNKVDPLPVEWNGMAKVSFDACRTKKTRKSYGGVFP